jgi:formate-dependent nitrite reductase cytochrome c552 subunit
MTKRWRQQTLWAMWILGTVCVAAYLGWAMQRVEDADVFLPGETSHGHYQIETKCNLCHTPMNGVKQDACLGCHKAELEAANDSHPPKKFLDPRNADRAAALDARLCITCHREHVPELTRPVGVTMPEDYCFRCHADLGKERPSHVGLSFQTCASSGCHNFHDNRALYEDFLVKHAKSPDLSPILLNPGRDFAARYRQAHPETTSPLTVAQHNGPADRTYEPELLTAWAETAHARSGVNCQDCHVDPEAGPQWVERPTHAACATCHQAERDGFLLGHHGMRLDQGLSAMTPGMARMAMKADAADRAVTCVSCHRAHTFDTRHAAVKACMNCHNDEHTRAYLDSKHYPLWHNELQGIASPNSGVSCATCHLPREQHQKGGQARVVVQHNQNDNLRPNEKMIRSVCMNCHGLRFSIDALADDTLVANNFTGQARTHIESIDWAMRRMQTERNRKTRKEQK